MSPRLLRSTGALALVVLACPAPTPEWPDAWEQSLRVDRDVGAFLSVWGPSPQEVYAVGGNPTAGVIRRFDGEGWREEALPPGTPLLNWIDGSSGAVWVVGNDGVALRQRPGGGWERHDTGVTAPLWGVWGAALDDIWAVGGEASDPEGVGVMVHWDGAAWAEVALPPLDRASNALFKVWGTAPDHAFAVGRAGVILRYDGAAWVQVPSGTSRDLISLWGAGPDEIVAVGGRGNAVVARWDGAAWTSEVIGAAAGLNGVWVDDARRAWVCGVLGGTGVIAPGERSFEVESITNLVLHGAFGFDGGPRFVVGGSLDSAPPWEGVVYLRGDVP